MIGKHVVIDTLDNFKAKLDLIPSSAIVLIKDVGQIYAHGTYFGAQKTYSLLTKTADGLAPKGGTSASSLISNVNTEWVLTVTNGENPTWRKLPANAFSSSSYTLPSATTSDLGGIKVGQVYTATFDDLVGQYYKINVDKNGLAYVHVPWVNNPYTASGSGITLKDNVFSLSLNSVTKLDSSIGNKIYAVSLDKNGKLCVSVPWVDTNNIFVGATETKNGSSGMVPAPIANQHSYFLRGDGTWVKPNLSDLNDDVVNGKYVPLMGDSAINGWVNIVNAKVAEGTLQITSLSTKPRIRFEGDFSWGYLGFGGANNPCYYDNSLKEYNLIHSGNIGSQSVSYAADADKVDGYHSSDIFTFEGTTYTNGESSLWDSLGTKVYAEALPDGLTDVYTYGQTISFGVGSAKFDMYVSHVATEPDYDGSIGGICVRSGWNTDRRIWRKLAFMDGNVASANKLKTPRTIWGQSFDGSGDVSGNLTLENNYEILTKNTSGSASSTLYRTKSNNLVIGEGIAKESNDTYISGNNLFLRYGTGQTNGISLISSGNVGIGVTTPSEKLHISGGTFLQEVNNQWLTPARLQIGRKDTTVYSDRAVVSVTDGNLHIDAYKDKMIYLNYYQQPGTYGLSSTAVIIDADGNTGIGVTPAHKLHVSGNIYSTNTVYANNFNSRVATGTQPYACTSTTLNTNLNADLLDGFHAYQWFTKASDITNTAIFWISTGSCSDVSSMSYAALINVMGDAGRRWQIWNSRNDHLLYWRPEKSDMSDWEDVHVLLDSHNYKNYVDNLYWADLPLQLTSNSATKPTFGDVKVIGGDNTGLQMHLNTATGYSVIRFYDKDGKNPGYIHYFHNYNTAVKHLNISGDSDTLLTFGTWSSPAMVVKNGSSSSYIGMGTSTPAYKLHIVGNTYHNGDALFKSPSTKQTINIGYNTATWYGDSSLYPLIWAGADNNYYTMIAMPHIPYLKTKTNGYTGTTFGSVVRFAGYANSTLGNSYWDAGCIEEDVFSIARNGSGIINITSSKYVGINCKSSASMFGVYGNLYKLAHLDSTSSSGCYLSFYESSSEVAGVGHYKGSTPGYAFLYNGKASALTTTAKTTEFRVWDDGGFSLGGTKHRSDSSWYGGTTVIGRDNYDKAIIGSLQGKLVFGSHNSNLDAWAPVYLAGSTVSIGHNNVSDIYINASGDVGIGTTSPAYKLDVAGVARCQYVQFWNTSFNGNAGYIGRGAGLSNDIYLLSSGSLHLGTSNVDSKVFINTSGNVGIGNTNPANKLVVTGGEILQEQNNTWLKPARVMIGRNDGTTFTDRSVVGTTDGNLHLDSYKDKDIYLNFYSPGTATSLGRIYFNGGTYYIKGGYYNGTAESAGNANTVDGYHLSVTTSAGTNTSTIYFVT